MKTDLRRIATGKLFKKNLMSKANTIEEKMKIRLSMMLYDEKLLEGLPYEMEIIGLIANAKEYIFSRYIYDAIKETSILKNKNALKIMRIIAQKPEMYDEFFRYVAFKKIVKDNKTLSSDEIVEIAMICLKGNENSLKEIIELSDKIDFLSRENGIAILKRLSIEVFVPERYYMEDYLEYHNQGEDDLKVVKMIGKYASLSRLECAHSYAFSKQGKLLEDEVFGEVALETIEHFKDSNDEKKLFSCFELYNEETDPTIKREVSAFEKRFFALNHKKQLETVEKIKKHVKL